MPQRLTAGRVSRLRFEEHLSLSALIEKERRMKSLGEYFVKKVPGFVVGDVWSSRPPENMSEIEQLVVKVAEQLLKHLPTEQDIYWFVVEEYDRIHERGGVLPTLRAHFPLFEIEHEGRRSQESYVGKSNPGVVFLDEKVSPPLTERYGETTSNQIRAGVYVKFRELASDHIDPLRLKYAVHYHNNCVKTHDYHHADLWSEVIASVDR
jgi:hypothetical protein